MHLYLIRHADAVPLGEQGIQDDEQRPLTPEGEAQAETLAQAIARLGVRLDALLTSPLVRAKQTAQRLATKAARLKECPALAPGHKKRELLELLLGVKGEAVGLVGHNPDLSELVGWFVGDKNAGIDLDKSGVACVAFDGKPAKGGGVLVWLITPDWSAAVAGERGQ
jgi:phosphohistidine phosphatase